MNIIPTIYRIEKNISKLENLDNENIIFKILKEYKHDFSLDEINSFRIEDTKLSSFHCEY